MCTAGEVTIVDPLNKTSSVNEGGKLSIVCYTSLGGSVIWLHNDRPISLTLDSNRYTTTSVPIGTQLRHYLTVNDVRMQDAGTYTCQQTYSDNRDIDVSRITGRNTHQILLILVQTIICDVIEIAISVAMAHRLIS